MFDTDKNKFSESQMSNGRDDRGCQQIVKLTLLVALMTADVD